MKVKSLWPYIFFSLTESNIYLLDKTRSFENSNAFYFSYFTSIFWCWWVRYRCTFFIYKHKLFSEFHNSFIFIVYFNILCSICSIRNFRNTIFCKYSISFFCLPHIIFYNQFKCYFILFHFVQFPQTHLHYFCDSIFWWSLSYCCFFFFLICLFSLFCFHCSHPYPFWALPAWLSPLNLFYNFFFKSLCLLFDTLFVSLLR